MRQAPYLNRGHGERRRHADEKQAIVLAPHARIQPLAVMIKVIHALVAQFAMLGCGIHPCGAKWTPAQGFRRRPRLRVGRAAVADACAHGRRERIDRIVGSGGNHRVDHHKECSCVHAAEHVKVDGRQGGRKDTVKAADK